MLLSRRADESQVVIKCMNFSAVEKRDKELNLYTGRSNFASSRHPHGSCWQVSNESKAPRHTRFYSL